MKLSAYFEAIYRPRKRHGKSLNTVRLYRITLQGSMLPSYSTTNTAGQRKRI